MRSPVSTAVSHAPAPLVDRLLAPFRVFADVAAAGGIVLLAATAVALAWANSPWAGSYHHLWETPVSFSLGAWSARLTLHQVINDGLMAVFFFLVGLEIKREFLAGELKTVRTAALPMIAAIGGMAVPAALYVLVNRGGPGADGWGVPMATDIAFALGVLALLGDRIPTGLRVFLAALAIVDDIGAVLVIALFYSDGLALGPLAASIALLALAAVANAMGVRRPWTYGAIGLALLGTVAASGIHATVAGVLLAMTIPVRTRVDEAAFLRGARHALEDFDAAAEVRANDPDMTVLANSDHHTAIEELETLCEFVQPPLIRIEHALHGIVVFGIMPLFALANAGVHLDATALRGLANPIGIGVMLGLVLGKPLGIVGASWLAVRSGLASLPARVTWRMVIGAGVLGGIGFTMALFIAGLAFGSGERLDAAKLAILGASTLSGLLGWLIVRRTVTIPQTEMNAATIHATPAPPAAASEQSLPIGH